MGKKGSVPSHWHICPRRLRTATHNLQRDCAVMSRQFGHLLVLLGLSRVEIEPLHFAVVWQRKSLFETTVGGMLGKGTPRPYLLLANNNQAKFIVPTPSFGCLPLIFSFAWLSIFFDYSPSERSRLMREKRAILHSDSGDGCSSMLC